MDIQKEKNACAATPFNSFGLDTKAFKIIGEYFRLLGWLAAKAQAILGGFVLVSKECSDEMAEVIATTANVRGGIYDAVIR